jgi:hypothetical protein
MSARERLALYGCDEPLPQRLTLRAGPLSLALVGGRFGPVHAHGHEVWHGLAFLFRDAGWGTPEPVFDVLHHRIEVDLMKSVRIQGIQPRTHAVLNDLLLLNG